MKRAVSVRFGEVCQAGTQGRRANSAEDFEGIHGDAFLWKGFST
ncbi:MAG: hypothetical protein WAU53_00655 [Rhodoplanes sp.]